MHSLHALFIMDFPSLRALHGQARSGFILQGAAAHAQGQGGNPSAGVASPVAIPVSQQVTGTAAPSGSIDSEEATAQQPVSGP
jgi:hypothetical protein